MKSIFLIFTVTVAVGCIISMLRYFPVKWRKVSVSAFVAWVLYAGILGHLGIVADTTRTPPGPLFILGPVLLMVGFASFSGFAKTASQVLPMGILLGAQFFRFVLELFLHSLWQDGRVPRMMTYSGANFDIVMGGTALLMAVLAIYKRVSPTVLVGWNLIGIGMVINVATRGVLTVPGPMQKLTDDFPNTAVVTFPYVFIPGLMVPLALILHALSIRKALTPQV